MITPGNDARLEHIRDGHVRSAGVKYHEGAWGNNDGKRAACGNLACAEVTGVTFLYKQRKTDNGKSCGGSGACAGDSGKYHSCKNDCYRQPTLHGLEQFGCPVKQVFAEVAFRHDVSADNEERNSKGGCFYLCCKKLAGDTCGRDHIEMHYDNDGGKTERHGYRKTECKHYQQKNAHSDERSTAFDNENVAHNGYSDEYDRRERGVPFFRACRALRRPE